MAKRKATLYIEDELLTAAKITAAAAHRTESAAVEDALRAYLSAGAAEAAGASLRDLLRRLAERPRGDELSDEAALALAVQETRAVRAERRTDRPE